MNEIRFSGLVVLALLLLPALCQAETLAYMHDGKSLFSVTFPDSWLVDTDFVEEAKEAGTYKGGEPDGN